MVHPPDDDLPPGGELPPSEDPSHGSRGSFVPEFVRKVAVAGLGAIFMTEEGIRTLAGQLKLPKEVLGYILSQAEKTKDEVGRVVSEEIRRFLQSEKLREEFLKLMAGMTVEVKAEVRLKPTVPSELPVGSGAGEAPEGSGPEVVITELNTRRSRRKKE